MVIAFGIDEHCQGLHFVLDDNDQYFNLSLSLSQKKFKADDIFNGPLYYTKKSVNEPLNAKLASAVYLQVSTISQALIFVTRSRGWSFTERPGLLLVIAFIVAQLVNSFILFQLKSFQYITLGRNSSGSNNASHSSKFMLGRSFLNFLLFRKL